MSAPGRLGQHARAAGLRVVRPWEAEEPGGRRQARKAKEPTRVAKFDQGAACPRCGVVKAWLRPGETCAPCLATKGPPVLRLDDEEPVAVAPLVVVAAHAPLARRRTGVVRIEPQEDEMAKTRTATCEECEAEFRCAAVGRAPKRCPKCKARSAAEDEQAAVEEAEEPVAEEAVEAPAPAPEGALEHVAALAVAMGLDPVGLLLESVLAAHRARTGGAA